MEIIEILANAKPGRKHVAAYCRVSTKHEEQESSLDTQIKYYDQYIKSSHKLRSFRYREEVLITADDVDWLTNKFS